MKMSRRGFLLFLITVLLSVCNVCLALDYSGAYGGQSNGIPIVIILEENGNATTNIFGIPTQGKYEVKDGTFYLTIEAMGFSQTIAGTIADDSIEFSDVTLKKGTTSIDFSEVQDLGNWLSEYYQDINNPTVSSVITESTIENEINEEDDENAEKYNSAINHLQNEEYAEALNLFESLSGYLDAEEQILVVKENAYNKAMDYFAHGAYADAIDLFSVIPNFKDSSVQSVAATEAKEYCEKFFYCEYGYINSVNEKGLILKEYIGYAKSEIVVPYGVCALRKTFTDNNKDITSILLPDTLLAIEYGRCFNGCSNLRAIMLPESLQHIGNDAFRDASIESIIIPSSVTSVGSEAFRDCKSLHTVIFECPQVKLYDEIFHGCEALSKVSLPLEISEIPTGTFLECTSLEEFIIPETVHTIWYRAFEKTGLRTITIPDSVTKIEHSIFDSCKQLETAYLSDGLTIIPSYVFWHCTSLTYVKMPAGVTDIEASAFADCPSLNHLQLPDSLKKIQNGYFFKPNTVMFHVTEGTYGHRFAAEEGFEFDFDNDPENWSSKNNHADRDLLESDVSNPDGSNFRNEPSEQLQGEGRAAKTTNRLNFRTGPSKTYNVIMKLQKDTTVYVLSEVVNNSGERWARVQYNDEIGYLMVDYLMYDD